MQDEKYCYPNSDVLKNKLNIQNHKELFEAEKENMNALRDEFRCALLADPDFLVCTNKSMRRRFMKNYFVHHGKYLRAFMTADGTIDDGQITIFVDQTYAYYKSMKKKQ